MLLQALIERHDFADFRELHSWSIEHPDQWWSEAWSDLGIAGDRGSRSSSGTGFEDTRWFPDGTLNIVETLLAGNVDDEVVVAVAEDGGRRSLTRGELRADVAACASALRACGVRTGDRVAAWTPNVPETVIFALGALAIGAIVSTASTDFGPVALIDRFGQIDPTVLLVTSTYRYAGKHNDLTGVLGEVTAGLPSVIDVVVLGESDAHPT